MVSPMTCCIPNWLIRCLATKQKHKNTQISPMSAWKTHFLNSTKTELFLCEIKRTKVGVYPLLLLHGVFAIGAGGIISLWQSRYVLIIRGICSPALDYHSEWGSCSVFTLWCQPVTWLTPIHVGLNGTTEVVTLNWTLNVPFSLFLLFH